MSNKTLSKRFLDNQDGTVTDSETQLMWMKDDSWVELGHLVSWHQAQEILKKKNAEAFAGYNNWRFPTGSEAKTLFDKKVSNVDREGCEIHIDSAFSEGCGYTTWTSETRGAKAAMSYDYRADYEYWLAKENEGFPSAIRLVRTIKSRQEIEREAQRFVDNKNGTITDTENGLVWKATDSYVDLDKWVSWEEAKNYCKDLNRNRFGGYEDWRLPTRKEAQSICDPGNPIVDAYGDTVLLFDVFPPGSGQTSWTKTLNKNDDSVAMRFHYYNGDYKWHKKGLRSHGVRAVRSDAKGS